MHGFLLELLHPKSLVRHYEALHQVGILGRDPRGAVVRAALEGL